MPSVERIINRQLERWNLERRLEHEERGETDLPETSRPWIAISRQAGAGGGEVARRLGMDLGYRVFDREIVDAIANESAFRRATVESLDERVRSSMELYIDGLLHGRALERSDFLRHLIEVVWSIGQHGNAVLLGRGAHLILPADGGLRVRIVAGLEDRVRRLREREQISESEARSRVQRTDDERTRFLHQHFQREAGRPQIGHPESFDLAQFDLALNTSALGVPSVVRVIERALQEKMGFGAGAALEARRSA